MRTRLVTEQFRAVFVEDIPDKLEPNALYVSIPHATVLHLCACGCGNEVVNPLTPTDWRLSFNGKVSLSPSIGNWSFPCRSHYWITDERVHWSTSWSDAQIYRNRAEDQEVKRRFYGDPQSGPTPPKQRRQRWWPFSSPRRKQ